MDQREGISNFREIDADGNTVPAEAPEPQGPPDSGLLGRINPFIVVLWLLAALLIGGSFQLIVLATTEFGPNGSPGGLEQFGYLIFTLAPWGVLASILIVAGLLFWHANQWQKRHGTLR